MPLRAFPGFDLSSSARSLLLQRIQGAVQELGPPDKDHRGHEQDQLHQADHREAARRRARTLHLQLLFAIGCRPAVGVRG